MTSRPLPNGVVKFLNGLGGWVDDGFLSVDLAYEGGDIVLTLALAQDLQDGAYLLDTERYVLTRKE